MLAVAGGKGGCGKTTTTLGLALAAARRGQSVLAVDADVDVPDLHRVAGVDGAIRKRRAAGSPRRIVEHGASEGERVWHDPDGNAHDGDVYRNANRECLGGPTDPGHVRIGPRPLPSTPDVHVLPARPGTDPDSLADRIDRVDRSYDLTLVDCPAGGGRDAAIPLRAADRVVLVTTAGEPSLRDAAKTGAMARAVDTSVAGAVLTRAERVPAGVSDLLGTTTVEAIPPAGSPLRDDRVIRRHERVLRRLPAV